MNVIYSPRALRDLDAIADYYRRVADPKIAEAIGARIEYVIKRVVEYPDSAPAVVGRRGVRAALVLRFPYKIFYRVRGYAVEILHIRHTSRRPWAGE
jgi:plasmid stabilization system protein ParE